MNQKTIALKVDVDTYRGTQLGVPALVECLKKHSAGATFLFSLGPDNTGRALRRIFRPGFLKKALRTSVGSNYGLKTLCYGVLWPGPDIGLRCASILRETHKNGFEVGIHCWDHVRWQDKVLGQNLDWVRQEMKLAWDRFEEIFFFRPKTHGAAGWQINEHALGLEQEWGLTYASDTRGTHPFLPTMNGQVFNCPQFPTTLPTLDELVGCDGITLENWADHIFKLSQKNADHGHVFTLHAELEGMKYLPYFEKLLKLWKNAGCNLVSVAQLKDQTPLSPLPVHEVIQGSVPGRSGLLALQGPLRTEKHLNPEKKSNL